MSKFTSSAQTSEHVLLRLVVFEHFTARSLLLGDADVIQHLGALQRTFMLGHCPLRVSVRSLFQGSGILSRMRRRMAVWGTIRYLLPSISTSTALLRRKMAKSPFSACSGT